MLSIYVLQVFIACGIGKSKDQTPDDPFRKPQPGMWKLMERYLNSGIEVDMDQLYWIWNSYSFVKYLNQNY